MVIIKVRHSDKMPALYSVHIENSDFNISNSDKTTITHNSKVFLGMLASGLWCGKNASLSDFMTDL